MIRKSFDNTLDSIPQELQPYATQARLIDMIDFEKVEFNKAISLNPHSNDSHSVQSNPFANSKYELVKLGEVCDLSNGYAFKSNEFVEEGIPIVRISDINNTKVTTLKSVKIKESQVFEKFIVKKGDFLIAMSGATTGKMGVYVDENIAYLNQRVGNLKIKSQKILPNYRNFILYFLKELILYKAYGTAQPNISKPMLESLKIPLPPLEIQKQIVSECESLESRCNAIEQSIKAYQELIKAILWHCGITTESTKDFDSILMSLAELESKLDFELLGKTKQDSNAFLQNLTNTLNTLPTPQKENFISYSLNDTKLFNLSIGKRILDNELDTNGTIPVFSANVKKEFGFINKEILKDYEKDSVLWGIDGDWMVSFIPKGKKFYPTDHCGVLRANENFVDAKLASFVLEKEGERVGFSRNLRASIDRIKTLKISLPPLEIQTKITQSIETIQSQISFLDSALPLLQSQKQEVLKKYLF